MPGKAKRKLSEIIKERIKDMEKGKRLFAILLSVIMITAYMPALAFAAAEEGSDAAETVTEESRDAAPEEEPAEETGDDEADDVSEAEPAAAEEEKKEEVKADEEASEPEKQEEEPQVQDAPALGEGSVSSVEADPDVDLADSDELLWDYLNKELAEETGAAKRSGMLKSASRPRGAQLTGINRMIYDSLKDKINYLVDPDEGDDINSTSFRLTFSELLGKDYPLVTINGETTSKVPREDAGQFIDFDAGTFLFDYDKITDALLSDLPYALYWYDKTKGVNIGSDPSGYFYDDNYFYFRVGDSGLDPGILFRFRVSADYSETGETGTFELDIDKRDRARTAINTANGIISGISGGGNVEILTTFKDSICGLVEYDDDAADDPNTPYGDPWQMINIFDNDPATKTVCEGYSKAFQYLVDNTSQLSDQGIECDSVTGTMNGGTGAGKHMWNILHMDDGKNYVADITNCDERTVGNPDGLFIKECEEGGSAAEGYTCRINNTNYSIEYIYDDDTKDQFSAEELTISETPYSGGNDGPQRTVEYWSFSKAGGADFELEEGVYGHYDEDLGYFVYEINIDEYSERIFDDGDTITVKYEDEDEPLTYTYYGYDEENDLEQVFARETEDGWDTIDKNDITLETVQDEEWKTGDEGCNFRLLYNGVEYMLPFVIVENHVKSLTFTRDGYDAETHPIELIENVSGEWDYEGDNEYFHYILTYQEGDVLTINDEAYTLQATGFDAEMAFVSESGHRLTEFDVDQLTNKSEWDVGDHVVTLIYNGVSCDVSVRVTKNPIEEISFERPGSGDSIELPFEEGGYYYFNYRNGDILRVKYLINDVSYNVEYVYSEEEHDGEWITLFTASGTVPEGAAETISSDRVYTELEFSEGNDPETWEIGETHNMKITYFGSSCLVPVRLVDSNSGEHTHQLVPTAANAATCEEDGNSAYWTCRECGKHFSDAEGSEQIAEGSWIIEALGHDWGEWQKHNADQHKRVCSRDSAHIEYEDHRWNGGVVTTPATEEAEGVMTYTCTGCDETRTEVIPKEEHQHDLVPTAAKAATCEEDGNSAYWTCSKCGKYYSDAEGNDEITEGSWIIEALDHDWGEWQKHDADQHKRVCSRDSEHIMYEDHRWNGGVVTTPATEDAEGVMTYTCTVCDETRTEVIPKEEHQHDLVPTAAKAATCEEAGNSAYWTCSKCGKYYSDAEGNDEITEGSWIIEALDHDWGEWQKHDADQHKRVCSRDSEHIQYEDHSWDEGVVTTPATGEEEGVKTYTCTVCEATKTEIIPAQQGGSGEDYDRISTAYFRNLNDGVTVLLNGSQLFSRSGCFEKDLDGGSVDYLDFSITSLDVVEGQDKVTVEEEEDSWETVIINGAYTSVHPLMIHGNKLGSAQLKAAYTDEKGRTGEFTFTVSVENDKYDTYIYREDGVSRDTSWGGACDALPGDTLYLKAYGEREESASINWEYDGHHHDYDGFNVEWSIRSGEEFAELEADPDDDSRIGVTIRNLNYNYDDDNVVVVKAVYKSKEDGRTRSTATYAITIRNEYWITYTGGIDRNLGLGGRATIRPEYRHYSTDIDGGYEVLDGYTFSCYASDEADADVTDNGDGTFTITRKTTGWADIRLQTTTPDGGSLGDEIIDFNNLYYRIGFLNEGDVTVLDDGSVELQLDLSDFAKSDERGYSFSFTTAKWIQGDSTGPTTTKGTKPTINGDKITFYGDRLDKAGWDSCDFRVRVINKYNTDQILCQGVIHITLQSRCDVEGHNWGEPTYSWSGNSSVTAQRVCLNKPAHVERETAQTTYTVNSEPTFTEEGSGTYTAVFENEAFETQTKTVSIPKLEVKPESLTFESVKPLATIVGMTYIHGNSYYMDGNKYTVTYNNGDVREYVCKTVGNYVGFFGVGDATGEITNSDHISGGAAVKGENTAVLNVRIDDTILSTTVTVTGYETAAEFWAAICDHGDYFHYSESAATCSDTGHIEYWKCKKCGALFADPEGTDRITEEDLVLPVDPDAHLWEGGFVIIRKATADEEGIMQLICYYDPSHTKNIPIEKLDPETSGLNEQAESSVNDADTAASALTGSSTSAAVQAAEKAANDAYNTAAEAEAAAQTALGAAETALGDAYDQLNNASTDAEREAAQAAVDKAQAEYASALQASGDASINVEKANAVVKKVAVKKAVAQATASKAAAAGATKGTKTAVTKAETALNDAKAAASAAGNAVRAAQNVVNAVEDAGYGKDSDAYRAAAQALEEAQNEKTAADNAVTAAETALTKAQSSYDAAVTAEKKRQGTYNKVIPQVKGVKLSSKKTSITVKWTKLTSSQIKKSKVTKYEIWLCPDTKFGKSNTTIKTVTKSYSTKTFTKLKKGKKYYVKVRAIKYVKGVKNVGKWSSRKYIKTKK